MLQLTLFDQPPMNYHYPDRPPVKVKETTIRTTIPQSQILYFISCHKERLDRLYETQDIITPKLTGQKHSTFHC